MANWSHGGFCSADIFGDRTPLGRKMEVGLGPVLVRHYRLIGLKIANC